MAKVIRGITNETADLLRLYLGERWGSILGKGEDKLLDVKLNENSIIKAYDDCVFIILGDRRYYLTSEDFVRLEIL